MYAPLEIKIYISIGHNYEIIVLCYCSGNAFTIISNPYLVHGLVFAQHKGLSDLRLIEYYRSHSSLTDWVVTSIQVYEYFRTICHHRGLDSI